MFFLNTLPHPSQEHMYFLGEGERERLTASLSTALRAAAKLLDIAQTNAARGLCCRLVRSVRANNGLSKNTRHGYIFNKPEASLRVIMYKCAMKRDIVDVFKYFWHYCVIFAN